MTPEKCILYYRQTGTVDWTAVPIFDKHFIDCIELVLFMLNSAIPVGLKKKIKFEYTTTNRVYVWLIDYDIKMSDHLSHILGFKNNVEYLGSLNTRLTYPGVSQPNPLHSFAYIFICCDLVNSTNTPGGQMQLLRPCPIPTLDLSQSKRVTVEFTTSIYQPIVGNYFNKIRFYFYDSFFKEKVDFAPCDEIAYLNLKFKRLPFVYPI